MTVARTSEEHTHPTEAHKAACPVCNPDKTVPELNTAYAQRTSKPSNEQLEEALSALERSYFRVWAKTPDENGYVAGNVNVRHLVTLYLWARGNKPTPHETPDALAEVLACLEPKEPGWHSVHVIEGKGERFWNALSDAFANRQNAQKAKALPEPGPDLACEGFVPDPHSRFCDKCGYPQHEHRRAKNGGAE